MRADEDLKASDIDWLERAKDRRFVDGEPADCEHNQRIDRILALLSRVSTPSVVGGEGGSAVAESAGEGLRPFASEGLCKSDWVLVPREPTSEMVSAGFRHTDASEFTGAAALAENVYRAMVGAAPVASDATSEGAAS